MEYSNEHFQFVYKITLFNYSRKGLWLYYLDTFVCLFTIKWQHEKLKFISLLDGYDMHKVLK